MSIKPFGIINGLTPTSTGTQDYTITGFGTPKGALGILSYAEDFADNDPEDQLSISFGISDGSSESCTSGRSRDNQGLSSTISSFTSKLFFLLDEVNAVSLIEGNIDSFITDGIRINWTKVDSVSRTFTLYMMNPAFFKNVKAYQETSTKSHNTTTAFTGLGGEPDMVVGVHSSWNLSPGAENRAAWGFALNNASTEYLNTAIYDRNNLGFTDVTRVMGTQELVGHVVPFSGVRKEWWTKINSWDVDGFTALFQTAAGSGTTQGHFGFLACEFQDNMKAKIDTESCPASTGNTAFTGYGGKPTTLFGFASSLPAIDTVYADSNSNSMSWYHTEGLGIDNDVSYGFNSQDNVDISETNSPVTDDEVKVWSPITGSPPSTVYKMDLTSFDTDGFTFNFTTVNSGKKFGVVAFIDDSPLLGGNQTFQQGFNQGFQQGFN